jgi:hypothetical protein
MMQAFAVITPDGQRRNVTGERQIIAAAALFLGDGRVTVEAQDGAVVVPFMPGGEKLRWFREAFAADLNAVLRDRRDAVAATLHALDLPRAKFLGSSLLLSDPRRLAV